VVGWPPVRAFRKNALAASAAARTKFVKVAVDGAPYLRKVDLAAFAGYTTTSAAAYDQLLAALQDKFISHFTVRKCTHRRDESTYGATASSSGVVLFVTGFPVE
jgi:auxin-responsive protein IAA